MVTYTVFMHEWALAEAVVETVKKEIGGRKVASVESVVIGCGELQNIDVEILRCGLEHYIPDDIPLAPDAVLIKKIPAVFICGVCGTEWDLSAAEGLSEEELESIHFLPEAAHAFISCPACESPDYSVLRGRGVEIETIDFFEEEEH